MKNERAIVDKEAALEKTTDPKVKAQLKEEIADLKSTIKEQEAVLERKTSEVTRINEGIKTQDAKLEKLNKQLAEAKDTKAIESLNKQITEATKVKNDLIAKKADTNFKIPETKIDDALMTRANEYVTKTQNAVTEAQTKLNNEKIELAKIDKATKPTEYAAQQAYTYF